MVGWCCLFWAPAASRVPIVDLEFPRWLLLRFAIELFFVKQTGRPVPWRRGTNRGWRCLFPFLHVFFPLLATCASKFVVRDARRGSDVTLLLQFQEALIEGSRN